MVLLHSGHARPMPVQYVERMRPGACHMICAAWSAGGAFLAAGSADHHVRIYSVARAAAPRRVLETAVHLDAVDSIAWAHRGLRFVSGSKDGTAALWSLYATQWRHTLLRTSADDDQKKLKLCCTSCCRRCARTEYQRLTSVTMVCWDCSDEFVMTAVSDNTVRVWCSRTCTQLRALRGHRDEAYVLEPHPSLRAVLLSAGHDGQLFVWHVTTGEVLAQFHNVIEGQGEGAIFDAKWGGGAGAVVAASDSHGHVLLLGLGAGHPLLAALPTELFFHTDYRPLVRDALGGALDEQTEIPPHLMPPPFLVDVEGAPHDPLYQRLVPGRENLSLSELVPAADARSRLDAMIEALAADPATPPADQPVHHAPGVWRGEGVRHTAGTWQHLDVPLSTRPIVAPLSPAARDRIERASLELNDLEMAWYRREMRRRPVMISTATGDGAGRRRAGRRPRAPAPRARPQPEQPAAAEDRERRGSSCSEEAAEVTSSSTSDESVCLSVSPSSRSSRERRPPRARRPPAHSDTHSNTSHSPSKSDSSSSSSQYSDWEAGTALAPPARARRRPLPTKRYSPSTVTTKRAPVATPSAGPSTAGAGAGPEPAGPELAEPYRVGEWLSAVSPRKAPYHPQMGDRCLYFTTGHQRYFEAVSEKDLYKVHPRDKPWERMQISDCEAVKVVGIKYVIKPPRVVCLKLARESEKGSFTVRYHDMPDVIDFLVLRHQYDVSVARRWKQGDRFRCMIDDSWWTGIVLERLSPAGAPHSSAAPGAAANFLSLRVRWDNGEVERLSPWDLEPLDPERLPSEPGGAVPVLAHELEAVLCRSETHEWPPGACRAIAGHISQVMTLAVAEPFVAPVDLQQYPSYAMVVPYPVDLATIRARFENQFYRRPAAAQFDARYLASNAEQFNEPHSPIVRRARLVTDLLLSIISEWRTIDVVSKYHELAAAYHSSDDEPLQEKQRRKRESLRESGPGWREQCATLLRELMASADAEPFKRPVSPTQAPDYSSLVARPMDLGAVAARLAAGGYGSARDLAADVRLVFSNSRLYNTNKRSRIYSMTVRLSSLFEALWSRLRLAADRRHRRPRRAAPGLSNGVERGRSSRNTDWGSSSDEAPLTRRRADSWDSDAPLNSHSKGKGIGKKSKNGAVVAATSAATSTVPPLHAVTNGVSHSASDDRLSSSDSDHSRIQIVEEELAEDEVEVTYEEVVTSRRSNSNSHHTNGSIKKRARKRRRLRSSSGSVGHVAHLPPVKRSRERVTDGSWSSTSGSRSRSGYDTDTARGRYESDRSYRPAAYSSDDETPLNLYRQRQDDDHEAGPSSRTQPASSRSGGVSLRRRRSPRQYNEDSEDDSIAAISKRLPCAALVRRRQHQHLGAASRLAGAPHADHNYTGGSPAGSSSSGPGPVSISSRGRVRKLTAKARGLLRE
ncbi:PH-interacting protein isoform X2 [Leptidea sinapis]|uniref:PH-interacting protein isoform X2 n=1 Tax=Leptidea sinapis TaxID=189913 RepID=UPI0021C47FED|nr:PH-interacting protein isoform X2 [Leptidea sinapis]